MFFVFPIAINWSPSSRNLCPSVLLSVEDEQEFHSRRSLEYDFYRDSCPQAEKIVRDLVWDIYRVRSSVAPALLRLAFHDCFVEGCDASILLDTAGGLKSEKESTPNLNLKGFDIIDIIKSHLEEVCPGVVSCADIVVLAAREGVVQTGGPFYPVFTGRRDATRSFPDKATSELPSPQAHLPETLASFASKGFDERETVSLLGGHSIGMIHCKFFRNRLYNFNGTDKPDPSIDTQFLNLLRIICNSSTSASLPLSSSTLSASFDCSKLSSKASSSSSCKGSPSSSSEKPRRGAISVPSLHLQSLKLSSLEDPGINLAYEGHGVDFGGVYYRSLLHGRGILVSDQQLMSGEETAKWVSTYASDAALFRQDFARAMVKLSNLHVLTGSDGQVRLNCSKVV
ncbi:hypothetical protein GH714_022442 [Hevea brasiliensis]|uniref:Peroxidase n=1 Tax=Hevea brasiliensis TaxID=3981 RepID=A0A6A6LNT9_HEVBR|nr:hypothetical protein GH714_022442 [Hevea brasiliensis]